MRDRKYLESFKKNTEKKLKEMNIFKYLKKEVEHGANGTKECEWKQVHEQSNQKLKERLEVIETDYHVWGG